MNIRILYPITFLVNVVFSIIELLLSVRVLLKLFGANPFTPIVSWTYNATDPLLAPFANIFPNTRLASGSVLEIQSIIALLVYGFIAYLIAMLIDYLDARLAVDRPVVRRKRVVEED